MIMLIGMTLTFDTAATLVGTLSKLRAECCPTSNEIGTFSLVRVDADDCPSGRTVTTGFRQCSDCGCVVVDRGSAHGRARPAPIAALAQVVR